MREIALESAMSCQVLNYREVTSLRLQVNYNTNAAKADFCQASAGALGFPTFHPVFVRFVAAV